MSTLKIFVVTGTTEGGKTLFLNDLIDFLTVFNLQIQGFLSRGHFVENGNKDFILKDIEKGSEIHLASRNIIESYIPSGRFYFNPLALKMGDKIIDNAIITKPDIVIIDEIGPLELAEKAWFSGFNRLLKDYNGILVFSARKKLLDTIINRFKIHEAFIEDIELSTPRKTGESILSVLKTRPL